MTGGPTRRFWSGSGREGTLFVRYRGIVGVLCLVDETTWETGVGVVWKRETVGSVYDKGDDCSGVKGVSGLFDYE